MSNLTFQSSELLTPPGTLKAWQGPDALKFRSCVAAEFDNLVITAGAVQDLRSPLLCDESVLEQHGKDRRIRRYSTESTSSYRKRLAKWRQIWGSAGRAWGILRQLRIFLSPFGRPRLRYVSTSGDSAQSQWFTLAPGDGTRDYFELGGTDPEFTRHVATPANWVWDDNPLQYSRYWILIYTAGMTGLVAPSVWDESGTWNDPAGTTFWDGYFTAEQMSDIAQLCIDWHAPQSFLAGVFLVHANNIFNPFADPALNPDGSTSLPVGNYAVTVDPVTGKPTRQSGVTYSMVRTFDGSL